LTKNEVVVRKAKPDDSEILSEISGRLFRQTYVGKINTVRWSYGEFI